MSQPYRVEVQEEGCDLCGAGKFWVVVDSEDTADATAYADREDAEHMADAMNRAFERGLAAANPKEDGR